jgi:hypothetical protein
VIEITCSFGKVLKVTLTGEDGVRGLELQSLDTIEPLIAAIDKRLQRHVKRAERQFVDGIVNDEADRLLQRAQREAARRNGEAMNFGEETRVRGQSARYAMTD